MHITKYGQVKPLVKSKFYPKEKVESRKRDVTSVLEGRSSANQGPGQKAKCGDGATVKATQIMLSLGSPLSELMADTALCPVCSSKTFLRFT